MLTSEDPGDRSAADMLARLPEAHLVVAGGDDAGPFRHQARRVGVGGRVHFLDAVSDLAPLYRAAGVLLDRARCDPFAAVCFDTPATGTHKVIADRIGPSGLLTEGSGSVISVDDWESAEADVQRFLSAREPTGEGAAGQDRPPRLVWAEARNASLVPPSAGRASG